MKSQDRNWKICQLRGFLPRLCGLIPAEINFSEAKRRRLEALAKEILTKLDEIKIKRFTCINCTPTATKRTRNKKAYLCDYCGGYHARELYLVKRPKKS